MNRIDVVLTIVLVLFALRGFWRGFSREFFGFIGLIGGLAVAAAAYAAAEAYVPAAVPERLRPIAAFAAVFFAVDLAANLAGAVLHRMLGVLFLSPVNRLAGAAFGVAKGAAMAAIVLLLVRAYTPSPELLTELDRSTLARPLLGLAGEVEESARPPRRTLEAPALEEG
jgi:membrane protein required for colicin V production